jgi:hypothetical protein
MNAITAIYDVRQGACGALPIGERHDYAIPHRNILL